MERFSRVGLFFKNNLSFLFQVAVFSFTIGVTLGGVWFFRFSGVSETMIPEASFSPMWEALLFGALIFSFGLFVPGFLCVPPIIGFYGFHTGYSLAYSFSRDEIGLLETIFSFAPGVPFSLPFLFLISAFAMKASLLYFKSLRRFSFGDFSSLLKYSFFVLLLFFAFTAIVVLL